MLEKGDDCPKCEKVIVKRKNRNTGEKFLGCSGYPHCKFTRAIAPKDTGDAPLCPYCRIPMVKRISKYGSRNFYGCVNWKECGAKPISII